MSNKIDDLTLLVNSCDSYEDCWIPFFSLLDKYWPELDLPIVLNTEIAKFSYGNLNILCPAVERYKGKINWGLRFIESLKYVKTNYVLLLIDDFFISSPVNRDFLGIILNSMKRESAACVYLNAGNEYIKTRSNSEIIEKLKPGQGNLFNLQAAIWNKSKLIKFLRAWENPWSTERFGSKRAYYINEGIYCISSEYISKYGPVITYPDTGGIGRGQWIKTVVDDVLIANGITIDTNLRGFWPGYGVPITLIPRLKAKLKRFPKSLHSYFDLLFVIISHHTHFATHMQN